jgi:hypothetical protein
LDKIGNSPEPVSNDLPDDVWSAPTVDLQECEPARKRQDKERRFAQHQPKSGVADALTNFLNGATKIGVAELQDGPRSFHAATARKLTAKLFPMDEDARQRKPVR